MAEKNDVAGALLLLAEGLAVRAKNPGMDGYEPTPKQKLFHSSDSYVRLYLGGNRGGKTHGGVMEDLYWATGTHPYLKTPPPPVRIRVVCVDFIEGLGEIMMPKFKALVRAKDLRGGSWEKAYEKESRKLVFANHSEIQFMSYEQDIAKFAGTSQDLIHFDEEPPQHIYNECAARVMDTNGKMFVTMTPVDGITWVYEELYEKTINAPDCETIVQKTEEIGGVYRSEKNEVTVIEVGTNENKYISKKAQDRYFSSLSSEEEREARSKGLFVAVGGKVFKDFDRKIHVIPVVPNPGEFFKDCYIYTSTDHGWNNPTAWLWNAVFPDGRIVTFHEHYASQMTIKEHSEVVKEFERINNIEVYVRTGDPAMNQHTAVTGTSILQEYANNGLFLFTDSVPRDPAIGIAKMVQYFRPIGQEKNEFGLVTKPGTPMWTITENCVNFIRELSNLQWQKYESRKLAFKHNKQEKVQEKDDHAFDAGKYFSTFLPDLKPDTKEPEKVNPYQYNGITRYDEVLVRMAQKKEEQEGGAIQWETVETFN